MEHSISEEVLQREGVLTPNRSSIKFWERWRNRGEESPNVLLPLIEAEWQTNDHGQTRYLIGGGWSVDLATGVRRPHRDIDVILLEPGNDFIRPRSRIKIEEFGLDEAFVDMDMTDELLQTTQQKAQVGDQTILLVHPAITFIQKLGGYGETRQKDRDDARALLNYGKARTAEGDPTWEDVLQKALDTVKPRYKEKVVRNLQKVTS